MASDVHVDLEIEVEVDSDELELELGDVAAAETELTRDGLEIELEAEIERTTAGREYEEPEFDDSATDETVEEYESDVEDVASSEE